MDKTNRKPVTMNLCGVPPWAVASLEYNRHPVPLEIQGVRETHKQLFAGLAERPSWEERCQFFMDYMDIAFQMREEDQVSAMHHGQFYRNSYLRYLMGWMFDANSPEAAVLKGWVESRIGLLPTYHREPISHPGSESYVGYLKDRARASTLAAAIMGQLDLLYEYVQFELGLRYPDESHLLLYRGVHGFEDHEMARKTDNGYILRLNNLNSFTADFEKAWEFGTRVMSTNVPLSKILFSGDLLHSSILTGEEEYIAIGGEYEIQLHFY